MGNHALYKLEILRVEPGQDRRLTLGCFSIAIQATVGLPLSLTKYLNELASSIGTLSLSNRAGYRTGIQRRV